MLVSALSGPVDEFVLRQGLSQCTAGEGRESVNLLAGSPGRGHASSLADSSLPSSLHEQHMLAAHGSVTCLFLGWVGPDL